MLHSVNFNHGITCICVLSPIPQQTLVWSGPRLSKEKTRSQHTSLLLCTQDPIRFFLDILLWQRSLSDLYSHHVDGYDFYFYFLVSTLLELLEKYNISNAIGIIVCTAFAYTNLSIKSIIWRLAWNNHHDCYISISFIDNLLSIVLSISMEILLRFSLESKYYQLIRIS